MSNLDLFLFHSDLSTSCAFLEQGVDGIIVDLETVGKIERQQGFGTQINDHSIADLQALRAGSDGYLLCRLSSPDATEAELAAVLDAGVSEVIVPMLSSVQQAERICRLTENACKVTLMVETIAGTQAIGHFSDLPVARIYVGLNDLRISRQTASIFSPLADGLLESLRRSVNGPAFGFGGLTLPAGGAPLPVLHLYHEMARLDAGFTFLRRSFYRDADQMDPATAMSSIRDRFAAARQRTVAQVESDRAAMMVVLQGILAGAEHE